MQQNGNTEMVDQHFIKDVLRSLYSKYVREERQSGSPIKYEQLGSARDEINAIAAEANERFLTLRLRLQKLVEAELQHFFESQVSGNGKFDPEIIARELETISKEAEKNVSAIRARLDEVIQNELVKAIEAGLEGKAGVPAVAEA